MVRFVLLTGLATCGLRHDDGDPAGQGGGHGGGTPVDTDTAIDGDDDGADATVDCDDADPLVSPFLDEACDGDDDNCDGLIDRDDQPFPAAAGMWFHDADLDGYGDPFGATWFCVAPSSGWSHLGGDCDDHDRDVHPGVGDCAPVGGGGGGGGNGGANGGGNGGVDTAEPPDTDVGPPPPRCGDAHVDAVLGETCDDGNTRAGDGCSDTCHVEPPAARCGDGTRQAPEHCDDGNGYDGDGCSHACTWEDFHVRITATTISATDAYGDLWDYWVNTAPDTFVVGTVDGVEVLRSAIVYDVLDPSWSSTWSVRVPYGRSLSLAFYDDDLTTAADYIDTVSVSQSALDANASLPSFQVTGSQVQRAWLLVTAP